MGIGRGADAAAAVTQPSRTVSVLWSSAAVARRRPSIFRVAVAAVVAAVMLAIGAIIMFLVRRG
jgi:hypothetical protein